MPGRIAICNFCISGAPIRQEATAGCNIFAPIPPARPIRPIVVIVACALYKMPKNAEKGIFSCAVALAHHPVWLGKSTHSLMRRPPETIKIMNRRFKFIQSRMPLTNMASVLE
jgi:hypothetical protein